MNQTVVRKPYAELEAELMGLAVLAGKATHNTQQKHMQQLAVHAVL